MNDQLDAYRIVISAISQINPSSSRQSRVQLTVHDYGWLREVGLLEALIQGQLIPGEFGDADWESVIEAFQHLDVWPPPSRGIAECCRELPWRLPNF